MKPRITLTDTMTADNPTNEKTDKPRPRRRARVISMLAALAVGAFGLFFAEAQLAGASAFGCSGFGSTPFSIQGVPLRRGRYCVTLAGQGTYVQAVQGSWKRRPRRDSNPRHTV